MGDDARQEGPRQLLLGSLSRSRAETLALVHGLRPEDWTRPMPRSRWHAKDVVAHISTAEPIIVTLVQRRIPFFAPLIHVVNAFNAWRLRGRTAERILADMAQARARTEAYIASLSDEELDRPYNSPFIGPATVSRGLWVISRHERNHVNDIRKMLLNQEVTP